MVNLKEYKNVQLDEELQSSYIDYAMSVIIGRAIPDARDGLKPVQRRILYSMYILKNFHNLPTKKSARIVGECFVKDTLVLTNNGLIPIQNIERGDKVYTQSGIQKVSKCYVMPKRKVIRVSLANGTENIVTSSQQFKILTKDWKVVWKDAKNLQEGDYILTKALYPDITKMADVGGKKLNENLGYLLGQLLSDGFVIHDYETMKYHRIGFCSVDPNVIKSIVHCLKEEFDYIPAIEEKHQEYVSVAGQSMVCKIYQIQVHNRKVSDFFIKNFNLLGCKAWNKKIPDQIFVSPQKVIYEFLSGLIDGDGHVHKNRTHIQYATTSEVFANQLMLLLQHLGIHGKKYELKKRGETYVPGRKVTEPHGAFSLEFEGINAQRLAIKLNLREQNKKRRAKEILDRICYQTDSDILPWAGEKIFSELSQRHIGSGWYIDDSGEKFRAGIKYPDGTKIRYSPSPYNVPLHYDQIIHWGIRDKLIRIKSPLSEFINQVIESKIHFSQVLSIEDVGEAVTYDIQVENQHEFVANGMVSHNCMGKFHPHGDVAIYEALIRMAQDFSMNHRMVEGQGNMGSIDGDPPAAARYTEVRLTKMAEEILEDLDKETVDFLPNFDNTEQEPYLLPSKIPNLLVNGASGIAVGVATSMPPHNMNEVCDAIAYVLDHKEASTEEILGIIKGPDFPTGGIAIMSQNAYNGYRHGRGQTTVRAKADIDQKKKRIVITEIPYNVNKATLVQTIAELVRDKQVAGIKDLRDESDKKGVRLVIDLKEDVNPEQMLNILYKHTQLEVTFPIINLAVVGKSLRSLNVMQLITTFIDYRKEIIVRRSQHELTMAQDRLHIVQGLLIAINSIEEIIKEIKASGEPSQARQRLMSAYKLSEKQANAILDMKLGRLTRLESGSLNEEAAELGNTIKYHTSVISEPAKVAEIIKAETLAVKKAYGKERKTEILNIDEPVDILEEDMISDEPVTIIMTNGGYVKRQNIAAFKEQGRGGRGVIAINLKEGDYVKEILACKNKDYLLCISNTGRAYWIKAYNIPESSRYGEGKAVVNLLNIKDEKIVVMLNMRNVDKSNIVFLTAKGVVKKTDAILFSKPRSNGVRAINLRQGDEISDVIIYSSDKYLTIITKNGKAIKFEEADLRQIGRSAAGVRGIRIKGNDTAKDIISASDIGSILTVTEKGYGKLTDISKYRTQGRGGSGVINLKVNEKTGPVSKALFVSGEQHAILINSKGISITIPIDSIRITGRAASGVRLMKLEPGSKVVDARVIKSGETPPPTVQLPSGPHPPQEQNNIS